VAETRNASILSDERNAVERRSSLRPRALLSGILLHGAAKLTVDCSVRDLTDAGARVRLPRPLHLASPAVLIIPTLDKAFAVSTAWQDGGEVGLAFGPALDLCAPRSDLDATARRLWLERRGR
jgi:hypothetical protein